MASALAGRLSSLLTRYWCRRKHLPLGPGHGIGLSARCSVASALAGRLGNLRPVLGLQYEMGAGAAMWAGDQFDLRQKLRLTRNLALEVRHSVRVHA